MMTKTQYAKFIVKDFCRNNLKGIEPSEVKDWGNYLYMSSSLAVALEYLGLLTEEQKKYSSTRGGVIALYEECNKDEKMEFYTLTTRELLKLLPDECVPGSMKIWDHQYIKCVTRE